MYDCAVQQVQFSVDGKLLATAGRDGYVRLWDTATLRQMGRFQGLAPIAFSPDGKALVSTTRDPVLVLLQLADVTGVRKSEVSRHWEGQSGRALAAQPGLLAGRILALDADAPEDSVVPAHVILPSPL